MGGCGEHGVTAWRHQALGNWGAREGPSDPVVCPLGSESFMGTWSLPGSKPAREWRPG